MDNMDNTIELNKIVGEHLGKAGDGSAVNPYVTPDNVDTSLLVPVPRYLNREQYNIKEDDLPFEGVDVWNAYEVSCLLNNGYPLSGIIKITYDVASKCIVESKSLKLYLNSYNMVKLGESVVSASDELEMRIGNDLSDALETPVLVKFFRNYNGNFSAVRHNPTPTVSEHFEYLEDCVDLEKMTFDIFNESADILDIRDGGLLVKYTTNVLRSNCRVTNQPDWGDVYITYEGPKDVTPESLLQYIVSMRKENHFHEEICECIFKRLIDLMPDNKIAVCCLYTRRGGIDINPLRYNDYELAKKSFNGLMIWDRPNDKTERQ